MRTMYIACNNCMERGYFLGDVITMIKAAELFVRNEPADTVLLSLFKHDSLNFLWLKFVRTHGVRVMWDDGPIKDRDGFFDMLQGRIDSRCVHGVPFDDYKELYARLDGEERQFLLCGEHRGIGWRNIFEYYYYGQPRFVPDPEEMDRLAPGLLDYERNGTAQKRTVFIAPHEQSQKNRIFTLDFWEQVVNALLQREIRVILNTNSFMIRNNHSLLMISFLQWPELINQVGSQRLVVCGNTGIGWVAACTDVPFIAMEKDMYLDEYSFEKCGCQSLLETVREPNAEYTVDVIERWLAAR